MELSYNYYLDIKIYYFRVKNIKKKNKVRNTVKIKVKF